MLIIIYYLNKFRNLLQIDATAEAEPQLQH